jgi:hypothetical protein
MNIDHAGDVAEGRKDGVIGIPIYEYTERLKVSNTFNRVAAMLLAFILKFISPVREDDRLKS